MTTNVPSSVDPITGLDTAINDPFLYQIPLTTNPIQAPEWGWRGHVNQVLYPDHIPSIFATAQGYDESNPGAAQAHHMDGDGNLYVNVRKNEASSGATNLWATAQLPGNQRITLNHFETDSVRYGAVKYIFGVDVDVSILDFDAATSPNINVAEVFLTFNHVYGFMCLSLGGYYDGTKLDGTYTAHGLWMLPNPIDAVAAFGSGANDLSIYAQNNTRFNIAVDLNPIFIFQ